MGNSCEAGRKVKCVNANTWGEARWLYVLWDIFRIFENPHLIHNLPLVAHITLTLRPCKTCGFLVSIKLSSHFARFKYLEFIGKCVILSIALAKPGTIFPVVREITRTKKV